MAQQKTRVSVPLNVAAKLLLAARSGLPLLPAEVRQQLAPMLTLEGFAVIAGLVVATVVAHAVGGVFAIAVDVVIGAFTFAIVGRSFLEAGRHPAAFYYTAQSATTEQDFDNAGREFASFVSIAGINTVLLLLARGQLQRGVRNLQSLRTGEIVMPKGGPEVLRAGWSSFINRLKFEVPENKGVLWSRLEDVGPDGTIVKGDVRAEVLARQRGLKTLEMALKDEGMLEEEDLNQWRREEQWRPASNRWAASLKGKVTAFVNNPKLYTALVQAGEQLSKEPLFIDEIETIADIIQNNGKITSVEVIDVSSGQTKLMLREQVPSLARKGRTQ